MSSKNCVNETGMNVVDELRENCQVLLVRADMSREMEWDSGMDHAPATAVTQERDERDGGYKYQPGPACSKGRRVARSRKGSTSSVPSRSSSASAAVAAQRKSSREAARKANRRLTATTASQQGEDQQTLTYVVSEEFEGDSSQTDEKAIPPPKKRKREKGKPQTTGLYVGRRLAIEKANKAKRESIELDQESAIRNLTTSEVLGKLGPAVEEVREELESAPTDDVAQKARQSLAEVLKIAKGNRNLKGTSIKALKTAAVVASASTEVLRCRADKEVSEDHVLREVRALRKELEMVKRAAKEAEEKAKAENDELREKLARVNRGGRNGRRKRAAIVDSPSPSSSPNRMRDNITETGYASTVEMEDDDPPMNHEEVREAGSGFFEAATAPSGSTTGPPEMNTAPPEYSDERRKAEIMPPRKEWLAAVRPAIRGKVKILEDGILDGHKVRVLPDTRTAPATVHPSSGGPKTCEAQSLMEAMAPMLTEWLRQSLSALGYAGAAGKMGRKDAQPSGGKNKGERKPSSNIPRPALAKTGNAKEGLRSTTVPNKKLWSEVVGGGSAGNAPASRPTEKNKSPSESQQGTPGMTLQDEKEWKVVGANKKKKAKRSPPTEARASAPKGGPKGPNAPEGKARAQSAAAKPTPNKGGGAKRQVDPVKKPPKRRPPRTAAVTLTCPPGNYAEAMRIARQKVNLREIGILALKPKRAATGAIILEVPGPDGAAKATALRDKMEEALREMEGVKVVRPVKTGDLRVKNIIDSTTVEEIIEEISRLGQCKAEEVRTGEIRSAPNGLGTLWLQCPLAAANKAAAEGKLELGWSSPVVVALEPRETRCFRCLERGHIQAACPNNTERRNLCYRCSQEGHRASECNNAPRCAICEGQGRPSTHKMGGKSCRAPGKKPGPPKAEKPSSSSTQPMPMDVDSEATPPAVRGEPTQNGRAPVPERRRKTKKEHRPAVRGGPEHPGGERVPVPVRPVQDKDEDMDIEFEQPPAAAPSSQEDSPAKKVSDGGASVTAVPSPAC